MSRKKIPMYIISAVAKAMLMLLTGSMNSSISASRCRKHAALKRWMDHHCNPSAMDVLKKMEPEEKEQKENPIWKGLEKFKNLEDN